MILFSPTDRDAEARIGLGAGRAGAKNAKLR